MLERIRDLSKQPAHTLGESAMKVGTQPLWDYAVYGVSVRPSSARCCALTIQQPTTNPPRIAPGSATQSRVPARKPPSQTALPKRMP
jgi:hypothetical protein